MHRLQQAPHEGYFGDASSRLYKSGKLCQRHARAGLVGGLGQSGREPFVYDEDFGAAIGVAERGPDFARKASVYYGDVTVHELLERTTWHSGQHVRQIMMVLDMLGIAPDGPIGQATFAGLPMPDKVWDDERPATSA